MRHPPASRRLVGLTVLAAAVAAGCAPGTRVDPAPGATAVAESQMPPPADGDLHPRTAAALQRALDDWLAGDNGIGVTAAVVTADGSWAGAAGLDGAGRRLVPQAAMAIASITKTFVAAEVVRLAGEGAIDLDAPVSGYVSVPWDDRGATVREVLAMRSGFPVDPFDFDELRAVIEDTGVHRHWEPRQVLDLVDPGSRLGQRGGVTEYNNINYTVLGMLVEEVTGRRLAEALRREVLAAAGLGRVWMQDQQRPVPPLARAQPSSQQPPVARSGPWLPSRALASAAWAAGGMAADAGSVARWGYLLYGGHVVDPVLVNEMTTTPDGGWYGLGTVVAEEDGERTVGHGGDIGVYHSLLLVWQRDHVAISVLVPQPAILPEDVPADELADILHDLVVDG